jgi:hypothetical protein
MAPPPLHLARVRGPRHLEVIVLIAVIAALASVPWFRHEPALARFVIAAVPCGISAASVATMRRLGPGREGAATA